MGGRVTDAADAWFAERTTGAPSALRERAATFFAAATSEDLAARLALAGEAALRDATNGGRARAAALDLLAADALITLALLATAERAPDQLARVATDLRRDASPTA